MSEEVFCNGIVEVVGIAENGEPLNLGRRSQTVPRKLRRFVLGRDGDAPSKAVPAGTGSRSTTTRRGPSEARPTTTV
jgi:hypothetical protein